MSSKLDLILQRSINLLLVVIGQVTLILTSDWLLLSDSIIAEDSQPYSYNNQTFDIDDAEMNLIEESQVRNDFSLAESHQV